MKFTTKKLKWIKKYPKILKDSEKSIEHKKLVIENMEFRKRENPKIKITKFFNIYNFRSFKTVRMICDIRNYRHIYKANNTIVETYCKI